jgi:thioredoxin-related protein
MNLLRGFLIAILLVSPAVGAEVPGFIQSWRQARQQAVEQDKLIYAHFTTEWCGWCRRIEQQTYPDPAVQEAFEPWVTVSLDCTVAQGARPDEQTRRNLELFHRYGGGGYPFLAMLRPDGALLNAVPGYVDPGRLVAELDQARSQLQRLERAEQTYRQADPNDYQAHLAAMRIFEEFYLFDRAAEAAEHVLRLDPDDQHGAKAEALWIKVKARVSEIGEPDEEAQTQPQRAPLSELVARVCRADAGNQGGFMERASLAHAQALIGEAVAQENLQQRNEGLEAAIEVLVALTDQAQRLENEAAVHSLLGDLLHAVGRTEGAVQQWRRAIAATDNERLATQLRMRIRQVEAADQPQ